MENTNFLSRTQKNFLGFFASSIDIGKKILLLEIEGDQIQAKKIVDSGISMKGIRFWFLIASCLIASIGLNTNSSAVVIGAMLISPLMGPILGLGFGLATSSKRMIKSSIQNLAFAIFISLLIASVYFFISPFQNPTPEILSRTAPNLLDLIVAVAAAFAGVVAMNSTTLAGAVPGVAIATAIMPPLCASAYGIAHGDWKIALGAFYLFFVNAFAISIVSFLLFKRMHFSYVSEEDNENGKIRPTVISLVILLIIAPLGYSLWNAWRDNFVERSVSRLVQNYKRKLEVVSWNWEGKNQPKLVLYNFKKAPEHIRQELDAALKVISLEATLEIHETSISAEMEDLATQMKSSQLSTLINNPKIIEALFRLASNEDLAVDLMKIVQNIESELAILISANGTVRGFISTQS